MYQTSCTLPTALGRHDPGLDSRLDQCHDMSESRSRSRRGHVRVEIEIETRTCPRYTEDMSVCSRDQLPVHVPVWPVLPCFTIFGPIWPYLADQAKSVPSLVKDYGLVSTLSRLSHNHPFDRCWPDMARLRSKGHF